MNYGKQFENSVKKSWQKIPDSFIMRIPDNQYTDNICDFIAHKDDKTYLLECKSHKGNTFPLKNLTQFDKMMLYKDITNIEPYVIIWYIDHKTVIAVRIDDVDNIRKNGYKSINIKDIHNHNNIVTVPISISKIYPDCDFLYFINNLKGNEL